MAVTQRTIPVTWYHIGTEVPVTPEEALPDPEVPRGALVVVEGRAPAWRYGLAFHRLHGRAAAVAVYDPKLGSVVVASHLPGLRDGEVLDLEPGDPSYDVTAAGRS